MGCAPSSTSAVKKITVQPPDEKVKLRLRLRGDIPSINGDMIHKTVADVVGIPPKRLEVTSSEEQTGTYFVTIFPDPGDEPEQVRRYMRQIIGQACGKGENYRRKGIHGCCRYGRLDFIHADIRDVPQENNEQNVTSKTASSAEQQK